jgi:hypothetical protein
MADAATVMRTVLEGLGPTNRIAQQLVNRLELAEDTLAEAEVISDELDDIWAVITALTVRTADAFERGIARLEDEANEPVSAAAAVYRACGWRRLAVGVLLKLAEPEETDVERCPTCRSERWVAVSLVGGHTRRRQCVPCGAIWPGLEAEANPD